MCALFRMRGLFVKMRTALKCNVHGQLLRSGMLLDLDEAERTERALKLDLEDNDSARIVDSLPGLGMITLHGFLAEVVHS